MRRLSVLLLFVLLLVKVAGTLARGPVAIELDAFNYWRLSSLVLSGDFFLLGEPIAYRTPLYPYFLAIVRAFSGPSALMATVVIQGMLALATLWISGCIAARITRLPLAMPLTLLAALPAVSALTFVAALLSETLFLFLMMLNVLAVLNYSQRGTSGRAVWIGVTFAAALMTRPIVLLLWVPHLVFLLLIHARLWFRSRKSRLPGRKQLGHRIKLHHRLVHMSVAALTVLVLVSPWLMRNQFLFGTPFLTEFTGRNVWIVTFQDGSGTGLELPQSEASEDLQWRLANVNASSSWRHTWKVSHALVASGLDDAQADRLMKQVSVDAISANQDAFTRKAFRRIVNFWRCAVTDLPPQGELGNYRRQQTWQASVPPIDWAIEHRLSRWVWFNTLLAALVGLATAVLIFNSPTRPYGIWIFLMFSYFAVVTGVLEIPAYRYRIVIEPLSALAIAAAVAVGLSWRRKSVAVEGAA